MKNLLLLCLTCCLAVTGAFAQGPPLANCTPDTSFTKPGLAPTDTALPCIHQGLWQEYTIQFKNFDTVNYQGLHLTLDSVQILSITNLPCGFAWSSNKNNNTFKNQENGCIVVAGETSDSVGQYELNITAVAFVSTIKDTANASSLGLYYIVRVIAPGDTVCPDIDSSQAHKVASCNTVPFTGVNEMTKTVNELNNYPNPYTGSTDIVFTSLQAKEMTLKVFNILGETLYSQNIGVNAGRNIVKFDGSKLNAGMYFYSISDGKQTSTSRMVITQ